MNTPPIRIRVFYPADPLGVVPGGIDTFLRGLIKWAPADLEFSLVGMTTDPFARPLARWTRCRAGGREFDFFPVVATRDAGGRGRVPLSMRFSMALRLHMAKLHGGFDVFDFHRLEPALLFAADGRPKNAYFHNDPQTLRLAASDNLWKHAPGVYERLERRAIQCINKVWCVRDSGVQVLQQRYPAQAGQIRLISTWVDPDVFQPADAANRAALRRHKAHDHGLDAALPWLITVGRLDTQKNPELMLRSLVRLREQGTPALWLVAGDGVLRGLLRRQAAAAGVLDQVRFLGLMPPHEVADWLRVADVFALPSAYEGMPMALLEALGCGLPAAVTDVGEVRRLVTPGVNGSIAAGHDEAAFAAALQQVLDGRARMAGAAATAAVAAYRPADVLAAAYDGYRELGHGPRSLRVAADAARRAAPLLPHRKTAVGIPVDALNRNTVTDRLMGWARQRESRYVCFVNVHSSVHAARDERHRLALLGADLNAPDGAPIAWTLGVKAGTPQQRVDGPGTMWRLCKEAAAAGVKVGLYGATAPTLQGLQRALHAALPQLQVAYAHAPPFRELTAAEDDAVCDAVARAGVGLLFVGLGCPKQEHWMAAHRGRIPAVMLGVGAAFDFLAGVVPRAPLWMRQGGMEWLHRLSKEPRRMGPRYLVTNSLFLAKTAREVARAIAPGQQPRARIAHTTVQQAADRTHGVSSDETRTGGVDSVVPTRPFQME